MTFLDVYHARDPYGDFLVNPLRSYHSYFASKISENNGLAKVAWLVGNVVTGIFAYPILGILALVGMALKYRDLPTIREHNRTVVNDIIESMDAPSRQQQAGWQISTFSNEIFTLFPDRRGYQLRTFFEESIELPYSEGYAQKLQTLISDNTRGLKKVIKTVGITKQEDKLIATIKLACYESNQP